MMGAKSLTFRVSDSRISLSILPYSRYFGIKIITQRKEKSFDLVGHEKKRLERRGMREGKGKGRNV